MRITRLAALVLVVGWLLLQGSTVSAGGPPAAVPRFHRFSITKLDEATVLDMVKDASPASEKCWLVYRARQVGHSIAVTNLGEVPCEPIPVTAVPESR